MNTIKFKLSDIEDNQKYRPNGYYEDVISKGEIIGEYVEIKYEDALALIEKYQEKNPITGLKNDANVWGPILWNQLHERSEIKDIDIDAELRWINIFTSWIPCGACKNHFNEILKTNPPDLSSPRKYKQWAIDVHNIVNNKLNKPIYESDSYD
jgi:hypothetical protein